MRTATIYNFLIEANIIAGIAILLMIPVRRFFRKQLGSRALCFAWLLVALRLLCPLALPNPWISNINTPYNLDPVAVRPIAGQVKVRLEDAVDELWLSRLRFAASDAGAYSAMDSDPVLRGLHFIQDGLYDGRTAHAVMGIYLIGVGGVAAWFCFANVRFRRKLKKSRMEPLSGELMEQYKALCAQRGVKALPVYLTDPLSSACLVGAIRPYIALPLAAEKEQAMQMLTHEICHYKAKDHIWTLIQLLCCAVHWFNPLVWLAARMWRMDRELRCDDAVTREMDQEGRARYAGALIQAVAKHEIPGMPVLATGMSMTGRHLKTRVKSILQGGQRVKAFAFAFVLTATVLLAGAFATAEMPYARGAIPESESSGALAAALSAPNAVKTQEEAIAIAREAWRLPALGVDTQDAQWSAFPDDTGDYHRPAYRVIARMPDENELICAVYADGSGMPTFYNPAAYAWRENAEAKPVDTGEPWRQQLKEFAYAFAEAVEPGVTSHFTEWIDHGNEVSGDICIATFEAWYDDEAEDGSKSFAIQISPVVRIIEYGNGNG